MMIPYEFDEALRECRYKKLKYEMNYGFYITKNGYNFKKIEKSIFVEKEKPIIDQIVDNVYASLLKLNPLISYDN